MNRKLKAEQDINERLSDSDRVALYEMRRDIWKGGLEGGAAGFLAGVLGYKVAEKTKFVTSRIRLEAKHRFAAPLLTGAMGIMMGSTTSARNNAHTLHYVLHKHATPRKSNYQEMLDRSKAEHVRGESVTPSPLVSDHLEDLTSRGLANYSSSSAVSSSSFVTQDKKHHSEWDDVIKRELQK